VSSNHCLIGCHYQNWKISLLLQNVVYRWQLTPTKFYENNCTVIINFRFFNPNFNTLYLHNETYLDHGLYSKFELFFMFNQTLKYDAFIVKHPVPTRTYISRGAILPVHHQSWRQYNHMNQIKILPKNLCIHMWKTEGVSLKV